MRTGSGFSVVFLLTCGLCPASAGPAACRRMTGESWDAEQVKQILSDSNPMRGNLHALRR